MYICPDIWYYKENLSKTMASINHTMNKITILDEMRNQLRRESYAYSTENSYCDWINKQ
jgi:lipid A disaccharide synthetase